MTNGKRDFGFLHGREFHLGLFRRFLQSLQGHLVFGEIDALVLLELVDDPVDDALVDVVAAQVRVAVGGLHFDDAFADFKDRNIERAAAKVVDGDGFVLLLVQTVGQSSGGRLIDDAKHFKTGDAAGIFRGLALRVVEVCRNRDDGLVDLLAQIVFRRALQLLQNHRGDFRRRIFLAGDLDARVSVRWSA